MVTCAGYKFYFALSQGAASVNQGESYVAAFRDSAGDPCDREVQSIADASRYFYYAANVVDTYDHLR